MAEPTPAELPVWRLRLLALQHYGQVLLLRSLDVMRLLTERIMGFLRLFATLGLLLIVLFVVYKAVESSQLVLVKPFAVPKSMTDRHSDAGRVIANALKQELLLAEADIYTTVKRTSRNGKVTIDTVTGNTEDYLLGASIKLPETGISINDVVEFIASLFGRRNITGTVYQDQGKLFLQVELEGRIFGFERSLGTRDPNALNMDLLSEMLRESRQRLLSVASESHNLYYYCSGEADASEHPDSQLGQWFEYCSRLQSSQITPESLGQLLAELHSARLHNIAGNNDTLRHIFGQIMGNALDKTRLLCPDYALTKVCQASATPEMAQIAVRIPEPKRAPAAAPPAFPVFPDASAFQADSLTMRSMVLVTPQMALPSVKALQEDCAAKPAAKPQEMLASNRTEGDATLLFNNNRPIQAVEKYAQAIEQNCGNVFAWANLGVVLMSVEPPLRSIEGAQSALEQAISLNNRIDWIQNNLCIARAWAAPLEALPTMIADEACNAARTLNPANKVILDKQFYLALAERYVMEGQYDTAADTYKAALSADRKRDCNTSKAIEKLALLETEHGVAGGKQAACDILQDALPLPGGKISACEAQLTAFQCP
ncbi:MAG: hypothetical protein QJT81_21335 [Candidatus Thiothrix putei]|uniref:Tetratricopeptide repeat protein n=1 Tax=Candidatus Thiothrix putei TaxID=3080811 RepID=A0AA95HE84_9GAMM|nr:MAG: hypothetical protein QJT81_21335 [Candidatus Thiothrix putei]